MCRPPLMASLGCTVHTFTYYNNIIFLYIIISNITTRLALKPRMRGPDPRKARARLPGK